MLQKIFAIAVILLISTQAAQGAAPKKDSSKKKAGENAKAEPSPEEDEAKAKSYRENFTITTRYKHEWIKMPPLVGKSIFGDDTVANKAEPGIAQVVFFLASWCEPCQKIAPDILALEKKFQKLPVRFIYVFTSDTLQDAQGFAKEYGVSSGIIANHDILRDYHGPQLPTIYVGDRHNWLAKRFLNASSENVRELEKFLALITDV